jgi:sec-independent protein translocase protein TatC
MALLDFFNRRTPDEQAEMSFLDHLEELRWHIIRSTIALLVCAIFVFAYSDWVVEDVLFAPTRPDFISARWLCSLGQNIGIGDALCFQPVQAQFLETTMTGQFRRRSHKPICSSSSVTPIAVSTTNSTKLAVFAASST